MVEKSTNASTSAFLEQFLTGLEPKYREIIKARFGLAGGQAQTLQEIGDRYGITRERVRQIEVLILETLRAKKDQSYLKQFVQLAVSQLKSAGGVQAETAFFNALQKALGDKTPEALFTNHARFLLELSGKASFYRDNYGQWHPYWYLGETDKKRAHAFVSKLEAALAAKKDEIVSAHAFDAVHATLAAAVRIPEAAGKNFIAVSKKFGAGPFGTFGLMEWPEVNPKTARDWAYVILKRERRPMHFTELSSAIAKHRTNKPTNLQTVHNELIKDNRFVLVGRGLYSLREFGIVPGTAREIIAHMLTKHGPMPSKRVIETVREQRVLKDATILINLQNKKHFQCLPDGRYCVRQA